MPSFLVSGFFHLYSNIVDISLFVKINRHKLKDFYLDINMEDNSYNEELYKKFFDLVDTCYVLVDAHGNQVEPTYAGRYLSQRDASRLLGCSSKIISNYRKRSYTGDIKALEEKIEGWIKREIGRITERVSSKLTAGSISFAEATTCELSSIAMEAMSEVINNAWVLKEIGIVLWKNAIGKTAALRRYAELNPPTFIVQAKPNMSYRTLTVTIAQATGVYPNMPTGDIIDFIVSTLKKQDSVIVVDDADYLSNNCLELIRCIATDRAGIGAVLLGSPQLENIIRHKNLTQLFSRVGSFAKVEKWIG
jgi:DNA transposition AAA+ family ATPase